MNEIAERLAEIVVNGRESIGEWFADPAVMAGFEEWKRSGGALYEKVAAQAE